MRRFFAGLAAVGLLGGLVGCCSSTWGTHGRCDCDDGYGCACCPAYASPAGDHGHGLAPAGPGYVGMPAGTPVAAPATTPASQVAATPK